MKKLGYAIIGLAICTQAAHAQLPNPYQNPYQPAPPTRIQPLPFGQGYVATTPGQPTTTIQPMPFGQGYTVNTPGQAQRRCSNLPFGQGVECR